jgi:YVTN family beta-propeller protein
VGEIKGIEAPHGITVAKDNSRIYISEEADDTLVVIDGKTMKVTKRIKLSGNPNLVDITPDGKTKTICGDRPNLERFVAFPEVKPAALT